MNPDETEVRFIPSSDHRSAEVAVNDLSRLLQEQGVQAGELVQESIDPLPDLVMIIVVSTASVAKEAIKAIQPIFVAWINKNRAAFRSISIDGRPIEIENVSEDLIREAMTKLNRTHETKTDSMILSN